MPRLSPTTTPGFTNDNAQTVIRPTGAPSTSFTGQSIYELRCNKCRHSYGANGNDTHHRRCPNCQQGEPGEPLRQAATLSLFDELTAPD